MFLDSIPDRLRLVRGYATGTPRAVGSIGVVFGGRLLLRLQVDRIWQRSALGARGCRWLSVAVAAAGSLAGEQRARERCL